MGECIAHQGHEHNVWRLPFLFCALQSIPGLWRSAHVQEEVAKILEALEMKAFA